MAPGVEGKCKPPCYLLRATAAAQTIFTTPSRSFYPKLSLSYDSGAGNGPFGLGWGFSVPSLTRKTDKGVPQYRDFEDSDVFILSEAEDLVPVLEENAGRWSSHPITFPQGDKTYVIQRYRPRIEGLFARIERWRENVSGNTFWLSISRDNVISVYGATPQARVARRLVVRSESLPSPTQADVIETSLVGTNPA